MYLVARSTPAHHPDFYALTTCTSLGEAMCRSMCRDQLETAQRLRIILKKDLPLNSYSLYIGLALTRKQMFREILWAANVWQRQRSS